MYNTILGAIAQVDSKWFLLATGNTVVDKIGEFFQSATGWMTFLIPMVGGCMIGFHALQKMMAEGDVQKAAQHNQAMKNILVGTAIGMAGSALVWSIANFFNIKP